MADSVMVCVDDFERYAVGHLPKNALDYYRSGADDEVTLRRNVEAFKRLIIRPRFLRDISQRDLSCTLLNGTVRMSFPIGIAPTASQRMAHPEGECATAKAAAQLGTVMTVSTIATCSLEEVADAGGHQSPRFFQLYVYKDKAETIALVRRVEKAGYKALVVTVDAQYSGKRRADLRNGYSLPPHLRMANFPQSDVKSSAMVATKSGTSGFGEYMTRLMDQTLSWEHIDWLRTITKLPIILKGILTAEDATEALSHGVAAIVVSNHGARQLDSSPAAIEALPEIVAAVGDRMDVYMDGGIRTGNDVFKSLALGAKAVFVGRPVLWGLAHSGQHGVEKVLSILRDEFDLTLALAGCTSLADIRHGKRVVHEMEYCRSNLLLSSRL